MKKTAACSLLFACSTILGTSDLMAQGRGGKSSPSDHAATVKKIYGAVKAGKLSAKDAKAKMEAFATARKTAFSTSQRLQAMSWTESEREMLCSL